MPRMPRSDEFALDRQDRSILDILQRDNKRPQRSIADEVHLSAAAVQRRIAAMEGAGVIAANVALVDPDAVGVTITSIVEVHLHNENAATVDRAKALFRDAPEVQQCYYVTGGSSFVLVILAADMRVYQRVTRRLFAENESVKSYRSLIALDRVKTETGMVIP
ncbi:MAG TPA: Lrp/AsnC family transcriptional regulator [Roseateles sp.]|uniref:Lrp/AsnC family transcriptional regulator n=1 Tax=Roseateles sp. TaxID=1971397 RepID=UPI002ED820A5